VLVDLGKMKSSNFEYACRVTLPIKKDARLSTIQHADPLGFVSNASCPRCDFPIEKSAWFTALDLLFGFFW